MIVHPVHGCCWTLSKIGRSFHLVPDSDLRCRHREQRGDQMTTVDSSTATVDHAICDWKQGDVCLDAGLEFVHLADLSHPHSPASERVSADVLSESKPLPDHVVAVFDEVEGVVVVTQTCDIVRSCDQRPFVEVAPLVQMQESEVEEVRRWKRPAFAYVPAMAPRRLVADLDRIMTVEKAIVARWTRTDGMITDSERRDFARALGRKRARPAFADDFVEASRQLVRRLDRKHDRDNSEGAHLRALREIRVSAEPSWQHHQVQIRWWFVKDSDPDVEPAWDDMVAKWMSTFAKESRFSIRAVACGLDEMTALDYVKSERLDLDRLSTPRNLDRK